MTASPTPAPTSIAQALARANDRFVRAALLHSAASRLLEDFDGETPKYLVQGILGVERAVSPDLLATMVAELRAAAAAARAEAQRVLEGGVVITADAPPHELVASSEFQVLPQLGECIVINPRNLL